MNKVKTRQGPLGHERLIIKGFKDSTLMHHWLNNRYDNKWHEYHGELKAGTYAMVAGAWRNVKSLDSSLLAHV